MAAIPFFDKESNDLHNDLEQLKRQKSACRLHVVSIDRKNQTGIINDYEVSLTSCKCVDFGRRKLPCKHIYRLAHELGLHHLEGKVVNSYKVKNAVQVEKERAERRAHMCELSDDEIFVIDSFRFLSYEDQYSLLSFLSSLPSFEINTKE